MRGPKLLLSLSLAALLFSIYFCYADAGYQEIQSNAKWEQKSRPQMIPSDNEEQIIEDTVRLIAEGEKVIVLDPKYKSLILVVGNTGSGKSTITKFLTNASALESYWTDDGFAIRDPDGDISENSTIISKSLFPELFIDNETNTAFYDLPGFKDTRNSSVEIANAFFMKKVADHGDAIKLMFVVDYYSLKTTGSRDDFKNMVKQSINFVKDVPKLLSGVMLIASKVDTTMSDENVLKGIGSFLQKAMTDIPSTIEDPDQQKQAYELIKAFLTVGDSKDPFPRIGLFRTPDMEGPLTEIPIMMNGKPRLLQIAHKNTEYVPKSPQDFGISLSAEAKLSLNSLIQKTEKDALTAFISSAADLKAHYQKAIDSAKSDDFVLLDLLIRKNREMRRFPEQLALANNRSALVKVVNETYRAINVDPSLTNTTILQNLVDRLNFFDEANEQSADQKPPKTWIDPLAAVPTFVRNELIASATKLSQKFSDPLAFWRSNLPLKFEVKYKPGTYTVASMIQLDKDVTLLKKSVEALKSLKTFKQFATSAADIFKSLSSLGVVVSDCPLPPQLTSAGQNLVLELDPEEQGQSPINVPNWVTTLDSANSFIINQRSALANREPTILTSPRITNWGDWGAAAYCPSGQVVSGMVLKTYPYQGSGDDSAVEAVGLACTPLTADTPPYGIISAEGDYGNWGKVFYCPSGRKAVGYQLRVEAPVSAFDDNTATNNMRLRCEDNTVLEGDGLWLGEWRTEQKCPNGQILCGFASQHDWNTGIFNVDMVCCNVLS